ncbi:hypothetical protein ABZ342_42830 [Amycolatopsis sp. NPDC005961]
MLASVVVHVWSQLPPGGSTVADADVAVRSVPPATNAIVSGKQG